MILSIIYLGKYFMCTWKIFVFCCSCMKHLIKVRAHWLTVIFSSLPFLIFYPIYFQREVLKSTTIILHLFISPSTSVFINFASCILKLLLGMYTFSIAASSWWIDTFIINFPFYLWFFFSEVNLWIFSLKSTLFVINIGTRY